MRLDGRMLEHIPDCHRICRGRVKGLITVRGCMRGRVCRQVCV